MGHSTSQQQHSPIHRTQVLLFPVLPPGCHLPPFSQPLQALTWLSYSSVRLSEAQEAPNCEKQYRPITLVLITICAQWLCHRNPWPH